MKKNINYTEAIAGSIIMLHRLGNREKIKETIANMTKDLKGESIADIVLSILDQYDGLKNFLDLFDECNEAEKDKILENLRTISEEEKNAILYSNRSANRDGSGASDR